MDAQTFMKENYLRTAFNMFDQDGSGKIDASELNVLLSGEDFKDVYTPEQLAQAIAEVDENGDGEIDFNEFMTMMRSINWPNKYYASSLKASRAVCKEVII